MTRTRDPVTGRFVAPKDGGNGQPLTQGQVVNLVKDLAYNAMTTRGNLLRQLMDPKGHR
jgi:hypothetical protein